MLNQTKKEDKKTHKKNRGKTNKKEESGFLYIYFVEYIQLSYVATLAAVLQVSNIQVYSNFPKM